METEDREYFDYLMKRSRISFILRKFMYRSAAKEFIGKTLDVGCGLGELIELYKDSYGVDSNRFVVEYCKSRGLKCSVGSVYNIPFKDGEFDTVVAVHLLEHLDKPEEALRELKRVLRKGGKLILIVPNRKGYNRDKTHARYWDKKGLVEFLSKSGLSVKSAKDYPLPSFLRELLIINELRIISIKTS
jgi:SAM-dependent methyltransferase